MMTENLVTGKLFSAIPSAAATPLQLLETLGANLDEEFLLLLPQPKKGETTTDEIDFTDPDRKYVLMAFVCVCASGFSPLEKLDKKLADIHGPVPAYKEKLEGSMDKFFHKVEVGKYVTRVNWTVTVGEGLFAAGKDSTHGDVNSNEKVEELEKVDIDDVSFGCLCPILSCTNNRRPSSAANGKLYIVSHTPKPWSSDSKRTSTRSRRSRRKGTARNSRRRLMD